MSRPAAPSTSTASRCATPARLRPKAESNGNTHTARAACPRFLPRKSSPRPKTPTRSCPNCAAIATPTRSTANWGAPPASRSKWGTANNAVSCVQPPLPLIAFHLECPHVHRGRSRRSRPRRFPQRLRVNVSAGTRVIHCQHPNAPINILAYEPKTAERPARLLPIRND